MLWIGLAATAWVFAAGSYAVDARPFGYSYYDETTFSLAPLFVAVVLFAVVTMILPVAPNRRVRAVALVTVAVAVAVAQRWMNGEWDANVIQVPLAFALVLAAWLTLRSARPKAFAVLLPAAAVIGFGALFIRAGSGSPLGLVVTLLPALTAAALAPISSRLLSRPSGATTPAYGGFGQPTAGGYPGAYPPGYAPQNTLAIIAFVLSFFASIPGIVCGHVALVQIKRTGERGRGLAIGALVIGYVELALLVAYFVAIAALLHSA